MMCADNKKKKVLVTKVGFDGHDRGAKMLVTMLRDAGMEVVYLGRYQTPEAVVKAAIQEDADVIGVSYMAGDHLKLSPKLVNLMKENGLQDVPLIAGGVIPRQDIPVLKQQGVAEVFPPGSKITQIVDFINGASAAN